MAEQIDNVKLLIGLDESDTDSDKLLQLIIDHTTASLRNLAHLAASEDVPGELGHIVEEVAVVRFNRRKNEGMTAYTQEGESITFDPDDFSAFRGEIADYNDAHKTPDTRGTIRFISAYGGGNHAV